MSDGFPVRQHRTTPRVTESTHDQGVDGPPCARAALRPSGAGAHDHHGTHLFPAGRCRVRDRSRVHAVEPRRNAATGIHRRRVVAGRGLLPHGRPNSCSRDRSRDPPRGTGRLVGPTRHHRPARARRRRRPGGDRLQDRSGTRPEVRAGSFGRRALLLVPL